MGNLRDKAHVVRSVRRTGRSHSDYGHGTAVEMPARILRRAQQPIPNSTCYKLFETGLRNRRLTRIDDRHFFIADVDTNDFVAVPREARSRRHPDVTESEHRNFHPVTIAWAVPSTCKQKGCYRGLSGYSIVSTQVIN